jgi:hypothetical protein
MPEYLAGPLALLASAVVALALAALSAAALDFVLGKLFHQPGAVALALVWAWAHDWLGFAWCVSGTIIWLASRCRLRQKFSTHSEHVIEA